MTYVEISTRDRTRLLAIFTGTYFFAAFAALSLAPLLPFIQEDLLLSKASLGMLISILYLGALISGFPAGWLSDRWGIPVTISIGLLIQGVFTGIFAFISSFYLMIALFFIAGIGYGAVNPASSKGIIKYFTSKWRATAMAVKQMGFTAGNMAAAASLPTLAGIIGWRKAIFYVAVLVIICGMINYFAYPDSIEEKILVDNSGSSTSAAGDDKPVWKNRQIVYWSVLSVFFAAVQISGTVYMAVYLVEVFSYSKVMAGIFLSITQGGGALGRIIWGRISDIYFAENREREIILVGFIASAACIILGLLPANTGALVMGIVALVFGFTAVGYNVLFLTHIGEIAGTKKAGQAIGFWVTVAYSGVVVAPPVFGFFVDLMGFRKSWVTLGVLLGAAIAYTLFYTQKDRQISAPFSGK